MNAKELKRLLRKQTGCSTWRMIVPDKNYDVVQTGVMDTLIDAYRQYRAKWEDEKWDCDDIARDFWNYAKRTLSDAKEQNGIVGRVVFSNHAEIIYVQEKYVEDMPDRVYYIDQRDWIIRKPNRKPKWIEL